MISAELRALLAGRDLPIRVTTEVVKEAAARRFGSLLLSSVKQQGCRIDRSDELRLAAIRLRGTHHHDKMLGDLSQLADLTARCGTPVPLFKGLASSYSLYDEPRDRPCADLDVAVGSWSSDLRRQIFAGLGLDPRQIAAIEELAAHGRPIHEITVRRGGLTAAASIDAHFNPYGLLTRFRAQDMTGCWRDFAMPGIGAVAVPIPEFALAIALVNQTRKGGGSLWYAADAARLLQGRAGPIDWRRFQLIVNADGLRSICAHALWSIVDGLGVDADFPIPRPRGTRHWSPTIGEGPLPRRRRMTLLPLYRSPALVPEAVAAFVSWYVPGPLLLDARGIALGDRGVRRYVRAMREMSRK